MALSFPTKQTPPQANRSATYSLIAHSKVALATITTFQHAVVRTQNAGPAFSNGPQRHTECYTYPDTNGIMSACGYLKKKCKNPEHRPMKAGAVGENITCLFHFSSLTSSRQSVPLHARRGHFISPCEFVRKHLASWSWNPDLCGRVRTSLPPPCNDGNTMSQTSIGGKRGFTNEFSVDFDIGKCLFCDSLQSNFAASPSHMKRFQRKYLGHIII